MILESVISSRWLKKLTRSFSLICDICELVEERMMLSAIKRWARKCIYVLDKTFLSLKLFLLRNMGGIHKYQANPFNKTDGNISGRHCGDRFAEFNSRIPEGLAPSVLDIGCNEGYFTFKMAERGGVCIGIDWGADQINNAKDLAKHHNVPNALFARMDINEQTISGLPGVDLVICMSIFHHWARKDGEAAARSILQKLCAKATCYLVFETGQPDEKKADWADRVSFMGGDHEEYVKSMLQEFGFKSVTSLGLFGTTVSDEPRILYFAEK